MKRRQVMFVLAVVVGLAVCGDAADKAVGKTYVAVIDFETIAEKNAGPIGIQLADSVRLCLRRHKGGAIEIHEVIDKLTTREFSGPISVKTDSKKVSAILTGKMAVNMGIYGTVRQTAPLDEVKARTKNFRSK